jgi:glycosyltransferase involved in cell wall biosynthesis
MACGLPVVVTASGELPRVVGPAGRVVPEGDIPALVAALAGLAAVTGICVGCEVYLFLARRRGVELVA